MENLARSAVLREGVGALGGLLLVGGTFAVFYGMLVPGIVSVVLGGALTVCFMLAKRRVTRGGSSRGYSTSALRELGGILDPREPIGPNGYERGFRVAAFVVLFALVMISLGEIGIVFTLGFVHGMTGVQAPAWVGVLFLTFLPSFAAVIAGSTFALIHRRAFLWLEFRRIVIASTVITAGYRLAYSRGRFPELPDDVAQAIGTLFGMLMGLSATSFALCATSYLLLNTLLRKGFAMQSGRSGSDDSWAGS